MPDRLSLVPGPSRTESRWAPITTVRSVRPAVESAITFSVVLSSTWTKVASRTVSHPGRLPGRRARRRPRRWLPGPGSPRATLPRPRTNGCHCCVGSSTGWWVAGTTGPAVRTEPSTRSCDGSAAGQRPPEQVRGSCRRRKDLVRSWRWVVLAAREVRHSMPARRSDAAAPARRVADGGDRSGSAPTSSTLPVRKGDGSGPPDPACS